MVFLTFPIKEIIFVFYRNADYQSVTSQLDEIIPENTTIYGGMSFWLGLREHRFVPYMRTPWSKAVEKYHPEIVIMDDWVMAEGGLSGEWGGSEVNYNVMLMTMVY